MGHRLCHVHFNRSEKLLTSAQLQAGAVQKKAMAVRSGRCLTDGKLSRQKVEVGMGWGKNEKEGA